MLYYIFSQVQEHVQMLVSINVALIQVQELVRSGLSSTTVHAMFPAMRGVIVVLMQSQIVFVSS